MMLYVLNEENLPDPAEHGEWRIFFPEGFYERALRPLKKEGRTARAGAWLLLYYALKKYGISDLPGEYHFGERGKPERADIFFNLSHSGKYALCTVADREVGCDIERLRPVNRKLVRRFFSEEEVRLLESIEGERANRLYTCLWTLRESYGKKTGEGLAAVVDGIHFMTCTAPSGKMRLEDGALRVDGKTFAGVRGSGDSQRKLGEEFLSISFSDCQIAVCADEIPPGTEVREVLTAEKLLGELRCENACESETGICQ